MFCNIQNYITMKLANNKMPVTHISNAAGFGFYSIEKLDFDSIAIEKILCDRKRIPRVTAEAEIIGTDGGIPVTVAIGDNQASFLGSVSDENSVLVNIGTGSQVSVLTDKKKALPKEKYVLFPKPKICL